MANDIRFLCHFGEMQETTSKSQVGSSAMPHKKNPIYSERICGLARFVISLSDNPAYNAATQWLERTLDDSSNRRITLAEGFLATDAILQIVLYITQSWTIYPHVIEKNLSDHISELFLENVLMHATREGKDRQSVHHILHAHAQTAAEGKKTGKNVDIVALLAADKTLGIDRSKLKTLMDTDVLIGRSADQVKSFLTKELEPILKQHAALPQLSADLEV
jgi:adenylosuccinate lyase